MRPTGCPLGRGVPEGLTSGPGLVRWVPGGDQKDGYIVREGLAAGGFDLGYEGVHVPVGGPRLCPGPKTFLQPLLAVP